MRGLWNREGEARTLWGMVVRVGKYRALCVAGGLKGVCVLSSVRARCGGCVCARDKKGKRGRVIREPGCALNPVDKEMHTTHRV
jgi:hypothetical protein